MKLHAIKAATEVEVFSWEIEKPKLLFFDAQAACVILSVDETIRNAKSNPEPQLSSRPPMAGRGKVFLITARFVSSCNIFSLF